MVNEDCFDCIFAELCSCNPPSVTQEEIGNYTDCFMEYDDLDDYDKPLENMMNVDLLVDENDNTEEETEDEDVEEQEKGEEWVEMSYNKFDEDLLTWQYDEYSDGTWQYDD